MGIRVSRKNVMEYLKAMAVLVVMAVPLAFIVNCTIFTSMSAEDKAVFLKCASRWYAANPVKCFNDSENSADGDQITVALALLKLSDETAADLSWMPPEGASDFQFDTLQPTNAGGSPPFLFPHLT